MPETRMAISYLFLDGLPRNLVYGIAYTMSKCNQSFISVSLVMMAVRGSWLLCLGDIALVWANTLSMVLQALYTRWFIQRYCASKGHPNMINWRVLLPSLGIVVAFAVVVVCTRWSEATYAGVRLSVMAQKGHVAMGGICLIACLLSWCMSLLYRQMATVF